MSRYASYFRALLTGYGLVSLNILYSLALIPLALSFLGKEKYGLWAMTLQLGVIAHTIEMSLTVAFNRILMDYKDDKQSEKYRQTFYTVWIFFAFLGMFAALTIALLAPSIIRVLEITGDFTGGYLGVLRAYAVLIGLSIAARPLAALLFIHQRSDVLNIISSACLILSFGVIWFSLSTGFGLWSFIGAAILTQLITVVACLQQVRKRSYMPVWKRGGSLSIEAFKEVFDYGKDRLVLNAGLTILQTAPTFIVTRIMGLEATAVWAVASKVAQLCLNVLTRICDFSYPALVEMHVRGEHTTLRKRYMELLIFGLGASILFSGGMATCNSQFIELWTGGKITTSRAMDFALAFWLITQMLQRFLYVPVGIGRDLKGIRTTYLIEGGFAAVTSAILVLFINDFWVIPVVFGMFSFAISGPAFLKRGGLVLKTSPRDIINRLSGVAAKVFLPVGLLTVALGYLPLSHGWFGLFIKSSALSVATIALLSLVPEIRVVFREMRSRTISKFQSA